MNCVKVLLIASLTFGVAIALSAAPDVNHVLKSVGSDDRAANIATYSNASLPLGSGVVSAISDFLAANTKAARGI